MRRKLIFKAQMGKGQTSNSQQIRAEALIRVGLGEPGPLRPPGFA